MFFLGTGAVFSLLKMLISLLFLETSLEGLLPDMPLKTAGWIILA